MFILANAAPVHTTGVNIQSVLAIVASITVILGFIGALFVKYITSKITGSIHDFQDAVVDKLDTRLTIVETKIDTVSRNNPKIEPARRGDK